MSIRIGFTGTRFQISYETYSSSERMLQSLYEEGAEFHHGDCVGADISVASIAHRIGYKIIAHPPISEVYRGYYTNNNVIHTPDEYLARNIKIVAACDLLLATPFTKIEQRRSGTWYTVRRARELGKGLVIIYPDGSVAMEKDTSPNLLTELRFPKEHEHG